MRLHFQERPLDLYIVSLYTVAVVLTLIAIQAGNFGAVFLVLFAPGYVLVAVLFPRNRDLDWIERVALSTGLSIAVVPLLGLLLNFTPWGIRFAAIASTIVSFTILVGLAAWWRRVRLPVADRLAATVVLSLPDWRQYGVVDKILTIGLAASIVVALGVLTYVFITPRPGEAFTEFYLLGPGGNASGYPTRLNLSEAGTVIFGIANHEFAVVNYTVRVDFVGVNVVFNASCNCNQTREVNRTSISWLNRSLGDNEKWSQPYTFRINGTGLWKVQFLLFRDADFSGAYRESHLYVLVS